MIQNEEYNAIVGFKMKKTGVKTMIDTATRQIARYVQDKGVKISAISRGTGIPDGILRRCLATKDRALRADEFLSICDFLEIEPIKFRGQDTA